MSSNTVVQPVFADNTLAYDCQRCGGKCCKYHGDFHISGAHDLVRFESHPRATPYLFLNAYSQNPSIRGESISPRCWYLREDHACDLEVQGGIESKPLNCILFPVNQMIRVNDTVYVNVSFACPLGVASDVEASGHVISHREVSDNITLIEQRCGSLDDYSIAQARIPEQKEQQINGTLDALHTALGALELYNQWDEVIALIAACLSKHCQAPAVDALAVHQLLVDSYGFSPPDHWQQHTDINDAMAALAPSLFFRFAVQEGLLRDNNASLELLATQALIKLCALRYGAELALAQGDAFQGVATLTQLSNKQWLHHLWLLPFGIGFIPNQQPKISVPSHLQATASTFLNIMAEHNNKSDSMISVAQAIKQGNIEPQLTNALLEVLVRNQQNFEFRWQ